MNVRILFYMPFSRPKKWKKVTSVVCMCHRNRVKLVLEKMIPYSEHKRCLI